ncbi:sigma-70 family RNA polymerase sigma factor [Cetobacterium somerae]|uniref:sigma-70 family RNA polymerase sigma factor n=1 Tax=Cetobacterium sp. NK01 TaxID=2993530 RepID=UPI002116CA3D|nr:sigma-70 family RNA polymerase sigma factor [Cetobacterium sp. NK01]MCQ8213350.1 sigma-70 family RNA polymerase sigma factor [Cetobacterium sp. NK01]
MNKYDILKFAREGDEEAIEKIIKQYNALVCKTSRNFFIKGGDSNDLIQEGFIGLFNAIKNYDESKNACFITFAHICIKRQIITAIKNSNADKFKVLNEASSQKNYSEHQEKISYSKPSLSLQSPEDILLGKELVNLLQEYLNNSLSDFEKKVLYYLVQQQTYLEIAQMLNDTPKRIDNTIQRIKKKIKTYLNTYIK